MDDPDFEQERDLALRKVGRVVLDRYRIEALLGIGGIGVVYQALDCESGDLVVVKTLRAGLLEVPTVGPRFLREARITMNLQHPAVPRGIAVGIDEERTPLLVMEYVPGNDFHTIMIDGPRPVADALRIAGRIAEALEAAHSLGIVHRDIKPENVMLLKGAEIPQGVYVLDFGIAFCLDEPRFTATNGIIGTPPYMSPEQARGEAVTAASDLYSLGATLVELLTGGTLYTGATLVQIASHQGAPIPDWGLRRKGLGEPIIAFVNTLLDKDPSRRPESAAQVAESLYALARWCEHPEAAPPSRDALQNVFALATAPAREELLAELVGLQRRYHRVMQDTAEAQRRLVQQLIEVSARRIGREGRPDSAAANVADSARENAQEAALTKLQQHSLREQSDLVAQMREIRRQLRTGDVVDLIPL